MTKRKKLRIAGIILGGVIAIYFAIAVGVAFMVDSMAKPYISGVDSVRIWDIRFQYDREPHHYQFRMGSILRFKSKYYAMKSFFSVADPWFDKSGLMGSGENRFEGVITMIPVSGDNDLWQLKGTGSPQEDE